MKKGTMTFVALAGVLLLLGFIIPVTVAPPANTVVIMDHTEKVYSTRACFEQAMLTNNLEETTLEQAEKLGYMGESDCTMKDLEVGKKPFLIAILQ